MDSTNQILGAVIDIDYLNRNDKSVIRLIVKGKDGRSYELFDHKFRPYFYFVPSKESIDKDFVAAVTSFENGKEIKAEEVLETERSILGKMVGAYKVFVSNTSYVPKLSSMLGQYGTCYEYDIPFAKRYSVDNQIVPLTYYKIEVSDDEHGFVSAQMDDEQSPVQLNIMCFDIEVYNPLGVPRTEKDPIIMISYLYNKGRNEKKGVITFKDIDLPFVDVVKDEKAMVNKFVERVRELDVDILVGYNSANFDIRYLLDRARFLRVAFSLSRYEGDTKIENHGLVDKVKIAGRVHVDMYSVIKFVAVVGAAEGAAGNVLKLNSKTLKNVYEAITGDKKFAVEKMDIYKLWDGERMI